MTHFSWLDYTIFGGYLAASVGVGLFSARGSKSLGDYFLAGRGLSVVLDWEGEHLGFPRVSASCDYTKPARFEQLIDIVVRIERLGSKSISYAFEFFHGPDLLARGKITCVCCRVTGQPACVAWRRQSCPPRSGSSRHSPSAR